MKDLDLGRQADLFHLHKRVPDRNDFDPDYNILKSVNFKHYTLHEFHNCDTFQNISNKSFSFLHCNIRSLNWLTTQKNSLINTSIPGFSFFSKPTPLQKGGVGFYVAQNVNFLSR